MIGAQSLIKALPATYTRPSIITGLVTANIGFYGMYMLSCGPSRQRMSRIYTLQPESGPQSLFTFHFAHTSLLPLLFNCGVLATLGASHLAVQGCASFMTVYGASLGVGALMSAADMRNNPNQTQAGGMAGSAGLIAYHAMRNPSWFRMRHGAPAAILGSLLMYGMLYDDKAALGGVSAGYAAFLLAL